MSRPLRQSTTTSNRNLDSSFRKLAKKHHPDQNKSDPKAKERFGEVNAAYESFGDMERLILNDKGR